MCFYGKLIFIYNSIHFAYFNVCPPKPSNLCLEGNQKLKSSTGGLRVPPAGLCVAISTFPLMSQRRNQQSLRQSDRAVPCRHAAFSNQLLSVKGTEVWSEIPPYIKKTQSGLILLYRLSAVSGRFFLCIHHCLISPDLHGDAGKWIIVANVRAHVH